MGDIGCSPELNPINANKLLIQLNVKEEELAEEAEVATEEPAIDHTAGQGAANVGSGPKSNNMSNPFAGTSWGA